MLQLADLKPLQREALRAALSSPTHSFQRTRAGFVPAGACSTHRSETQHVPTFSLRLMRMLDRAYLVELDDPMSPSRSTLTKPGLQLAKQLGRGIPDEVRA